MYETSGVQTEPRDGWLPPALPFRTPRNDALSSAQDETRTVPWEIIVEPRSMFEGLADVELLLLAFATLRPKPLGSLRNISKENKKKTSLQSSLPGHNTC